MVKQESIFWYLHNHKIFDQLTSEELKELAVLVGIIKVKKSNSVQLLKKDEPKIYFLKKGILKIIKFENSKEIVVDIITEGDIFGEVLCDFNNNLSCESIKLISEEAIICSFTKTNFEKILSTNPALCLKYTKQIGNKLLNIQQRYCDLIFKDVKTRLIEFLSNCIENKSATNSSDKAIQNFLTHQDIADLIGCQRQTVTTLLKELKEENKINYTKEEIRILIDS